MISFTLSIIIGVIYQSGLIENEYHAFDELKELAGYKILLLGAVFAPLTEELIFRAPLVLFKSPWKIRVKSDSEEGYITKEIRLKIFEHPLAFKIAFFTMAILFGYVHITNYQIDTRILLFSPILVAPQMILGVIFGFIRIRLGLIWAIAMHAFYNGLLISLFLIAKDVIQ